MSAVLEANKLRLEVEKLREETKTLQENLLKTREDRRWYNRHLAAILSLIGVLGTFTVGFMTWQLGVSQAYQTKVRRDVELDRMNREDKLHETDVNMRLAEFSLAHRDQFLGGDQKAQEHYVAFIEAIFDPEPREKILNGLAKIATIQAVQDKIRQAQQNMQRARSSVGGQDAKSSIPVPTVRQADQGSTPDRDQWQKDKYHNNSNGYSIIVANPTWDDGEKVKDEYSTKYPSIAFQLLHTDDPHIGAIVAAVGLPQEEAKSIAERSQDRPCAASPVTRPA